MLWYKVTVLIYELQECWPIFHVYVIPLLQSYSFYYYWIQGEINFPRSCTVAYLIVFSTGFALVNNVFQSYLNLTFLRRKYEI